MNASEKFWEVVAKAAVWIAGAVLLIAVLVAACHGQAFGQCGPGGCSGGKCPSAGQPWGQPPAFDFGLHVRRPGARVAVQVRAEKPAGHKAATVRITVFRSQERCIGSGVMLRWRGHLVIATCAHTFAEGAGDRIEVQYSNGQVSAATLMGQDRQWDLAVLAAHAPSGIELAELADENPQIGEEVTSCGYGPDGQFAVNPGKTTTYCLPTGVPPNSPTDWFELTGAARQGDSGGPIFDRHGRVAGILFGTNGSVVTGACTGRLRVTLERLAPLPVPKVVKATGLSLRVLAFKAVRAGRVILPTYRRAVRPPVRQWWYRGIKATGAHETQWRASPERRPIGIVQAPWGRPTPARAPQAIPEPLGPLVPIPDPAISVEVEAAAPTAGCLFGRNRQQPTPAKPQVIVQSDPTIGQALVGIDRRLEVIVQNTTPKVEPQKPDYGSEINPAIAAVVVLVAVLAGAALFFGTQTHTPIG